MTYGLVSARDRRVLLIGAVLIGVILLISRGRPALHAWEASAIESASELKRELTRVEANRRLLPVSLDSLESRSRRLKSLAPMLVSGDSPTGAGAALAALVTGAAAQAGVRTSAVVVRADTAQVGTFVRLRVQVDGSGDLPGIVALLHALESDQKLLVIRSFSITQQNAGGPAERPENLRVEMTVEGLAIVRTEARRAG